MHSDSRKAQRNSFAHHRAELLFSIERLFAGDAVAWSASDHAVAGPVDRHADGQHVHPGLLGFVPMGPALSA